MSGVVVLSVLINDRGEVMCVRPLKGLSHGLTSASIQAAEQWGFAFLEASVDEYSAVVFTVSFDWK